jgi:hypothetical protein
MLGPDLLPERSRNSRDRPAARTIPGLTQPGKLLPSLRGREQAFVYAAKLHLTELLGRHNLV